MWRCDSGAFRRSVVWWAVVTVMIWLVAACAKHPVAVTKPAPLAPPTCRVTPEVVDFGDVPLGDTATARFLVVNLSSTSRRTSLAFSSADFFTYGDSTIDVPAHDSTTFLIGYSAAMPGERDATVTISGLAGCGSATCRARAAAGSVSGYVYDDHLGEAARLPGILVQIEDSGRATTTDADGHYLIAGVPARASGIIAVPSATSGYQSVEDAAFVKRDSIVDVDFALPLDDTLEPLEPNDTIDEAYGVDPPEDVEIRFRYVSPTASSFPTSVYSDVEVFDITPFEPETLQVNSTALPFTCDILLRRVTSDGVVHSQNWSSGSARSNQVAVVRRFSATDVEDYWYLVLVPSTGTPAGLYGDRPVTLSFTLNHASE